MHSLFHSRVDSCGYISFKGKCFFNTKPLRPPDREFISVPFVLGYDLFFYCFVKNPSPPVCFSFLASEPCSVDGEFFLLKFFQNTTASTGDEGLAEAKFFAGGWSIRQSRTFSNECPMWRAVIRTMERCRNDRRGIVTGNRELRRPEALPSCAL